MEQKQYVLLLTEIECIKSSAEDTRDDVYFDIHVDDNHVNYYYKSNPLKMEEYDHDDVKKHLNIEVKVQATSTVDIYLWDNDDGSNDNDELGHFTITRDDAIEGSKIVKQTTGKAQAQYKVSWRILYKPIPTLRIHGIKCQKSSAGCDADTINAIINVTSKAAESASYVIGKVKTPKAQAISKGFEAAAMVIECVGQYITWIANAAEGDDDIYLQHIDPTAGDGDGGAFCPPSNSGIKCIKMNDDDEVSFFEAYGQYFRFPLDKGDVTIQIKDGDRSSDDDSLGALTINEAKFNQLLPEGAQVEVASQYLSGSGQGAVYHLCYSVAWEDWALPPVPEEPFKPISIGQTLSEYWQCDTFSIHKPGNYAEYFTFTVSSTTTVTISLDSLINHHLFLLNGENSTCDVIAEDAAESYSEPAAPGMPPFMTGPTRCRSSITQTLSSGSYTIEAVEYAKDKYDIVLSVLQG